MWYRGWAPVVVNQYEPDDDAAQNAVELANNWFQAHDAVDAVGLGSLLHPDVVVRSLFSEQPVKGRRAAVAHFQRTMADYPDLRLRIVAGPVAARGPSGQHVVADIVFEGHHRSSSAERTRALSVPGVVVLETTSAAVIGVRTYFDKTEWLTQIGLLEEAAPI